MACLSSTWTPCLKTMVFLWKGNKYKHDNHVQLASSLLSWMEAEPEHCKWRLYRQGFNLRHPRNVTE